MEARPAESPRRSSSGSASPTGSPGGGRVGYLIQNHLGPPQVARLVAAIQRARPSAPVLVVHDPFAGTPGDELRRALEVPVLLARERARRGYFSLLDPYFDGVTWLAENGVDYDWLVYISAQDYPTRPLAELETLLATSTCDGYLRHWRARDRDTPWGRPHQGRRRYDYQYYEAPRWVAPGLSLLRAANGWQDLVHVHLVYGPRLGIRGSRSPFDAGVTCWAGKQWTTLRRACAEHVTEQVRADGPLVRWFRRTVCPCEALVQTVLMASGRFDLRDDDLRFVDFAGSRSGSPRVLGIEDLPRILGGAHFFARKFDLRHDAGVLDRLDQHLSGMGIPQVAATAPDRE